MPRGEPRSKATHDVSLSASGQIHAMSESLYAHDNVVTMAFFITASDWEVPAGESMQRLS